MKDNCSIYSVVRVYVVRRWSKKARKFIIVSCSLLEKPFVICRHWKRKKKSSAFETIKQWSALCCINQKSSTREESKSWSVSFASGEMHCGRGSVTGIFSFSLSLATCVCATAAFDVALLCLSLSPYRHLAPVTR